MKRVAITMAAIAAMVVAGCGGDTNKAGGSSTARSDQPIILGAAIAQTGLFSAYDLPVMKSVELEVARLNAAGGIDGRKVEIVQADTRSDPAQGPAAAAQVLGKGAQIVLVTCDFDQGSPAALAAQQAGKVTFSLCAQSPKFGVQGIGPLAYTVAPATFAEGSVQATFAKRKGFRRPFLLVDNTISYDSEVCNGFKQVFGPVAGEALFKNGDVSIASQITALKNANPDLVVLCSYPPGGAAALRQLRAAGVDAAVISGNSMDGTYWINAIPNISDLYVSSTVSVYGDDPNPEVNSFVRAYARETGKPPATGITATGVAVVQAIAKAVERAGTTDGKAVAEQLDKFRDEPLLTGPTTFTPQLHINTQMPMAILRYTDGKPRYVTTIAPSPDFELRLK